MPYTSTPLKIIHVFRAPLGGLFRHAIDLTRGQIERGHHVGIFCDSTTGGARADEVFAELGPKLALGITRVPMSRYPSLTDLKAQMAAGALQRRLQPDVMHAHGSKGGLYARLPALLSPGRKYVTGYTPHGGSFNYKPGGFEHRIYMNVERLFERATDMFLFESAYIAGRFEAYVGHTPRTDYRVIVNGVSEAEFEPIDHAGAQFDLVYLGELRSAKGVDTLLTALSILRERHAKQPTILIVGSGPDEDTLRAMADRLNISPQCTFAPPGPIRQALARARIMVVPSRAESLPYVILEAAAAAQPLVSTNVGGIGEICGPKYVHRLIEPNDAGLLAAAINTSLDKSVDELTAEAADLAAFVHTTFRLDTMIDNVIAAYRVALSNRRVAQV
jgi:glycosyltransferase involved in cell wall biosynthesis